MIATFFICSDERRKLNKSPLEIKSLTIQLKGACSIINPIILLNQDTIPPQCNYLYIDTFNRYYFIDNITYNNGLAEISASLDTLYTYRNYILNRAFLVERQEFKYSPYIVDNELMTRADKQTTQYDIGGVGGTGNNYYLCTSGG